MLLFKCNLSPLTNRCIKCYNVGTYRMPSIPSINQASIKEDPAMVSMEQLSACGIVPVVVLNNVNDAVPTAKALLAGGINVMEITFRTAAAPDCIAAVAKQVPEMIVGAGTIINPEQLRQAVAAGAQFIVSPGSDAETIQEANRLNVPIVPGVVTPSEIMMGLKLGVKVFKFFPAEAYGGLKTIKNLCGPFPQIKFIPTGGISQANAEDYLKHPKIQAIGGSWMVSAAMVEAGQFDEITAKSKAATDLVKQIRG